jgi:zinc transporter 7
MKFQFGALALLSLAPGSLAHVPKLADLTEKSLEKSQPLYYSNGDLNLESMNQQLSECTIVKDISEKLALKHEGDSESMITYLFSKLFPFENPAYNALLATTYISGPPNLILGFIPASIDPSKLSMLIGFAIGGLLGDVFLHLLPQTFVGEPVDHSTAAFVLVDEKRNSILGLFIFIGFMSFFLIDKSLRILEHQQGHESSHSHSHAPSDADVRRHKKTDGDEPVIANPNASVKTSAYLNLISDFSHNITDGLAIAASFYISKSVGSTTCLAVFFHEIPHEVGDFALLIQGGFTKWQAMNSQFLTALGAYLGTFLGIFIQTYGMSSGEVVVGNDSPGLFGTSVTTGDLTLPFTAGGFLYIATVGVIPEILELEKNNTRAIEFFKGLGQLFFILIGISLMFLISWME